MKRLAWLLAMLAVLAACAAPLTDRPAPLASAMVALAGDPARARDLVVVIPGALTSVYAYEGFLASRPPGVAVLGYRFPGVDGRPRDRNVQIVQAGAEIAAEVNALAPDRVRLIGMSTGGPIALEAARRIRGRPVEVALLSSALPAPATTVASVVGLTDILDAAARAGSTRAVDIWGEYYRTLLYGRGHFRVPPLARQSARMAEAVKDRLLLPQDGLTRSHGANLLVWQLRNPEELAHARILFLQGAQDTVFPARGTQRLAARLPDARVILYPKSGHLLLETEAGVYDDMEAAFQRWGDD